MAKIRKHHLWALALSSTMHAALGWAIGAGAAGGMAAPPPSARMLSVYLAKAEQAAPLPAAEIPERDPSPLRQPIANVAAPISLPDETKDVKPLLAIEKPAEPHYFAVRELTEKPRILRDVPPDLTINMAGIPDQPAILRLLIDENGNIDRVLIEESHFPKQLERIITGMFSKIKFHPGKIGEIPVKSQLKIEVMLESAVPMP